MFCELYHNDALWVYMIQVLEEIYMADHEKVNDLVLCRLMAMGAWDWDQKDGGELNQATRAIRFSATLASCLLPRIPKNEAKVVKHCLVD